MLKTPPGTSEHSMYREESTEPPELVCIVGTTVLKHQLRIVGDLHVMLRHPVYLARHSCALLAAT